MIRLEPGVWRTLAALFATTYLFQFGAIAAGGEGSTLATILVGLSMYLPGVFALGHLRRTGRGWGGIGWSLRPLTYLALSLTVPAVLTLVGLASFEAAEFGRQAAVTLDANGLVVADLPLFDSIPVGKARFLVQFLLLGVLVSLPTAILTAGEEIGWRGFFQQELLKRNGLVRSVVFLGLVWALWHAPLILSGFNYPRTPVLGAFVFFPVAVVGVSGWLAWITLRSGSVWTAVFFHAGVNAVGSLVFEMDFGERDLLGQSAISGALFLSGMAALWFGARPACPPAG